MKRMTDRNTVDALREKLAVTFLTALAASFEKHGKAVIERVREESPAEYLKIAASLAPKEISINHAGGVELLQIAGGKRLEAER